MSFESLEIKAIGHTAVSLAISAACTSACAEVEGAEEVDATIRLVKRAESTSGGEGDGEGDFAFSLPLPLDFFLLPPSSGLAGRLRFLVMVDVEGGAKLRSSRNRNCRSQMHVTCCPIAPSIDEADGRFLGFRQNYELPSCASGNGQPPPSTALMALFSSPARWLSLYFVLNLTLTLYNKLVLTHFPFPYTLTALHALCGSIGSFALLHIWAPRSSSPQAPSVPKVHGKELVVVLLFSVLYTINIVVSNASLQLVTVPFHQCVRASAPLFTVALSALLLGKYSSKLKLLALLPVVAGVALATYGDFYYTTEGFVLTLLGTLLAALKTIITNVLQTSHRSSHTMQYAFPKPPTSPAPTSPGFPTQSPATSFRFPATSNEKRPIHLNGGVISQTTSPPEESRSALSNRATHTSESIDDTASPLLLHEPPPSPSPISSFLTNKPPIHRPSHSRTGSVISDHSSHRSSSSINNLYQPQNSLSSSSSTNPRRAFPSLLNLPKLSLTPLQLLYLLSPLAFIQTTLLAHLTGELEGVNLHLHNITAHGFGMGGIPTVPLGWGLGDIKAFPRLWLLLNGVLAFALNIVSFSANKKVGALGMTVAGELKITHPFSCLNLSDGYMSFHTANVKQVLAILLSITLFNLTITPTNGLGILLTLIGGACYAAAGLREHKSHAQSLLHLTNLGQARNRRTLSFRMSPVVASTFTKFGLNGSAARKARPLSGDFRNGVIGVGGVGKY